MCLKHENVRSSMLQWHSGADFYLSQDEHLTSYGTQSKVSASPHRSSRRSSFENGRKLPWEETLETDHSDSGEGSYGHSSQVQSEVSSEGSKENASSQVLSPF